MSVMERWIHKGRLGVEESELVTYVAVALHEPLLQSLENGLHTQRAFQVDEVKVVLSRHVPERRGLQRESDNQRQSQRCGKERTHSN